MKKQTGIALAVALVLLTGVGVKQGFVLEAQASDNKAEHAEDGHAHEDGESGLRNLRTTMGTKTVMTLKAMATAMVTKAVMAVRRTSTATKRMPKVRLSFPKSRYVPQAFS